MYTSTEKASELHHQATDQRIGLASTSSNAEVLCVLALGSVFQASLKRLLAGQNLQVSVQAGRARGLSCEHDRVRFCSWCWSRVQRAAYLLFPLWLWSACSLLPAWARIPSLSPVWHSQAMVNIQTCKQFTSTERHQNCYMAEQLQQVKEEPKQNRGFIGSWEAEVGRVCLPWEQRVGSYYTDTVVVFF